MSHKFATHRLFCCHGYDRSVFVSFREEKCFLSKKFSGVCFIVENRPKHERKDMTFDE